MAWGDGVAAEPHDGFRLAGLATQGLASSDGKRLRQLLTGFQVRFLETGRQDSSVRRAWTSSRLVVELMMARPDLVVMEGTGVTGGAVLILLRIALGQPYVVGTGDAVGPFVSARHPALGMVAGVYERTLYRRSHGVIAWTPYLAGRALTYGAPRAVTIPGWSPSEPGDDDRTTQRTLRRADLGIPTSAIVVGMAGSLNWNERRSYCAGWELVQAVRRSSRADIVALILGDGDGRDRLREAAGADLGHRILIPGRVEQADVMSYLCSMDVASLPQSVDAVGAFRYSTKLSEYVAARLPVITGETPAAYDLDSGWIFRLPGTGPWSERYIEALCNLLGSLDPATIGPRARTIDSMADVFDRLAQQQRLRSFLEDILASLDL